MIDRLPIIETPKTSTTNTPFLRPAEAIVLIHTAAPHLRPLLAFAVATGARPAEYLELTWQDVDLRGKRVTFRTKGGGFRHYDMPPIAIAALEAIKHRKGPVFLTPKGTRHRDTDREGGGVAESLVSRSMPTRWHARQGQDPWSQT